MFLHQSAKSGIKSLLSMLSLAHASRLKNSALGRGACKYTYPVGTWSIREHWAVWLSPGSAGGIQGRGGVGSDVGCLRECWQWFRVSRLWSRLEPEGRQQSGSVTTNGTRPDDSRQVVRRTGPKCVWSCRGSNRTVVPYCSYYNSGVNWAFEFLLYHDMVHPHWMQC